MRLRPVWHDRPRKKKRNPILVLIAGLLFLLVFVQFEVNMGYEMVFGRRFTTTDDLGLVTTEDFDGLIKTEEQFFTDKQNLLRGGFFYMEDGISGEGAKYKGVVVVSHGFGGGYAWYLPQIAYLARNGYLVFAFDKTGNDSSNGKEVYGLPQGIIDLEYALDYVRGAPIAKGLPILLYGHSWGGYSSCAVLQTQKDITAVASLSGFNTSQDMLMYQGSAFFGEYIRYLSPFLYFCDKMRFGEYADYSSLNGLRETDADVILLHSDDDGTIPIDSSFKLYKEELGDHANLTFVPLSGKKHDVYFSEEATVYRVNNRELLNKIESYPDDDKFDSELLFYLQFDRIAANAVDESVMKVIIDFFDKAVEKALSDFDDE